MPYLTGDSPDGDCVVSVTVPSDVMIRRAIFGQFLELCDPRNWETFGSGTADEYAASMLDALETFAWQCAAAGVDMLVSYKRSSNFPMTSGVWYKLTGLDTEVFDTGQWNAAAQRIDIDQDGLYIAQLFASYAAGASGMGGDIYINGSPWIAANRISQVADPGFQNEIFMFPAYDGDYAEFQLQQRNNTQATPNGAVGIGFLIWRLGDLL